MFAPKEKMLLWAFDGRQLEEINIIIAPTSDTRGQEL